VPLTGRVESENSYAPSHCWVTPELEQYRRLESVTSGVPRERTLAIRPSRAWLVRPHRHSLHYPFVTQPLSNPRARWQLAETIQPGTLTCKHSDTWVERANLDQKIVVPRVRLIHWCVSRQYHKTEDGQRGSSEQPLSTKAEAPTKTLRGFSPELLEFAHRLDGEARPHVSLRDGFDAYTPRCLALLDLQDMEGRLSVVAPGVGFEPTRPERATG
jgi:hypothetical protein